MVTRRRIMERRDTLVVGRIHLGASIDQHLYGSKVTIVRRIVKWNDSFFVAQLNVGFFIHEKFDRNGRAIKRSKMERSCTFIVSSVWVCTTIEQNMHYFPMTPTSSSMQRRTSLGIFEIDSTFCFVTTMNFEQEFSTHNVTVVASIVQCCTTILVTNIQLGSFLDESANHTGITFKRSFVQWRCLFVVSHINISTCFQKQFERVHITTPCSFVQWCRSFTIFTIEKKIFDVWRKLSSVRKQHLNNISMVVKRCCMKWCCTLLINKGNISSSSKQCPYHRHMTVGASMVKRCGVFRVCHVFVNIGLEQGIYHISIARIRCIVKRGIFVFVSSFSFGAVFDQKFHHLVMTKRSCIQQCSTTLQIFCIYVCTLIDQFCHDIKVSI
mmetsp:Transcript_14044/g.21153  ORF Transcript_14044/g.21153 Transcript_14044/m.21153 type:complete len:382 (+) Transcript_14044:1143-2288(+)